MKREYLWALLTLVLAIVLAIILLNIAHGPESAPTAFAIPERHQAHLQELDRAALDSAYTKQIELLYKTWVADTPTLSHDPSRITIGLLNNRRAWLLAMEKIEAKEQKQ